LGCVNTLTSSYLRHEDAEARAKPTVWLVRSGPQLPRKCSWPPTEGSGLTTTMDAETTQTRKMLGWCSPPTVGLALIVVPMSSVIVGLVAMNSTQTLADVLSDAIVLALAAAVSVLGASCRMVGTVDGIQVMNLFSCVELPAKNIARIRSSNGLVILTTNGKPVHSFAYGASLIGEVFGYRRARVAEQRCEAWVQVRRFDNVSSSRPYAKRFRHALVWVPLVLVIAYLAEALVIHTLTT
jgi:hypothetical protein